MATLTILTGENNPMLRKIASPITSVNKEIKKLIKDMHDTVKKADGIGLAAPQIGESIRLVLAQLNGKMTAMINPEIVAVSEEVDVMEEGCLSLPKVDVNVTRPVAVQVLYTDENGKSNELILKGISARVVQHEVDHLDGVLIVDYTSK